MQVMCFDVGGLRLKYAIISDGILLSKGYRNTPSTKEGFLQAVKQIVEDYNRDYLFTSLSFSFPGYINPYTGHAERSGALTYFTGCNIIRELGDVLNQNYTVTIENDANCAALAEKKSGAAVDNRSFIVATIGTGFGGGVFINNELVQGFQYKAGEFGQMLLSNDACKQFEANHRGSVKTLVSEYKQCKELTNLDEVTAEDVLNDMEDNEVAKLIRIWIRDICVALYNVATVMNPEKIIIGGGISEHPALLPLIKEQMECIANWSEFRVPIETCRYHNDAGLLGAYYHAVNKSESGKKSCE